MEVEVAGTNSTSTANFLSSFFRLLDLPMRVCCEEPKILRFFKEISKNNS